ncbi:hypothetical protein DB42_AY00330 [Neochlamydia sp. EPS4]|nr:hypothetical protein DB42_AY00330 [Neochlamydia sp. EPS4]
MQAASSLGGQNPKHAQDKVKLKKGVFFIISLIPSLKSLSLSLSLRNTLKPSLYSTG